MNIKNPLQPTGRKATIIRSIAVWLMTFGICLTLFSGPIAAQNPNTNANIQVKILPTVELLSALLTQSTHASRIHRIETRYTREALDRVKPLRDDSVIRVINDLLEKNIPLRTLIECAASVDFKTLMLANNISSSEMKSFWLTLEDASRKVDWPAFTAEHKSYYDSLASDLTGLVQQYFWEQEMSDYSGFSFRNTVITLLPMISASTFSSTDMRTEGVNLFLSPLTLNVNKLEFDNAGQKRSLRLLAEAALQTLFTNAESVKRTSRWYGLFKDKLTAQGELSWSQAVLSDAAYAVAERSISRTRPSIPVDDDVHPMAAFFQERLRHYEADRLKFPGLSDFGDQLRSVLDDIEPYQKGGKALDLGLAEVWLTDEGVPILRVTPRSPAELAGIKRGDIITSIAGMKINGSESYLRAWKKWQNAQDGKRVIFLVKRKKSILTFNIEMMHVGGEPAFRWKPGKGNN